MRTVFLAAIAALLVTAPASAQRTIHAREGLRPATMVEAVYADSERAAGVQGDVTVRGMVQTDGAIAEVAIAETSRSPALDEAALAAVRQWTFLPVEIPVPYQVQFEFHKDDLNNLQNKTCSDLNVDVAYFRQTFPELAVSDMPLKDLLVGIMLVMGRSGVSIDNYRRSSEAYDRTVEWCSTRDDELVLERYLRLAR
jgi:TonB family protein